MLTAAKWEDQEVWFSFQGLWGHESVFTCTIPPRLAASLSYWLFFSDTLASFSQHFSPHLSSQSPVFPSKAPCQTNLSSPSFNHSTIYISSPFSPLFQQHFVFLSLQSFLANSALSWDNQSATEHSRQTTCLVLQQLNAPRPLSTTSPTELIGSLQNPRVTELKSC